MPRPHNAETSYRRVQGLSRGLLIVRAMNITGGPSSVGDLSARTGLHRTTVRRLLETLSEEGYVVRSPAEDGYQLTLQVRNLSEGFTEQDWIVSIAAPAMGHLLEQVKWPSDLSTLDGSAMRIRESTHRFSALSFERAMVGRRMPLMFTASGRAYLAACDDGERTALTKLMIADGGPQAACAADPKLMQLTIDRVRRNGYAKAEGEWRKSSPAGAIALPIMGGGRVLACLNVAYLRRSMSMTEAAQELLSPLRDAVQAIEARISDQVESGVAKVF